MKQTRGHHERKVFLRRQELCIDGERNSSENCSIEEAVDDKAALRLEAY